MSPKPKEPAKSSQPKDKQPGGQVVDPRQNPPVSPAKPQPVPAALRGDPRRDPRQHQPASSSPVGPKLSARMSLLQRIAGTTGPTADPRLGRPLSGKSGSKPPMQPIKRRPGYQSPQPSDSQTSNIQVDPRQTKSKPGPPPGQPLQTSPPGNMPPRGPTNQPRSRFQADPRHSRARHSAEQPMVRPPPYRPMNRSPGFQSSQTPQSSGEQSSNVQADPRQTQSRPGPPGRMSQQFQGMDPRLLSKSGTPDPGPSQQFGRGGQSGSVVRGRGQSDSLVRGRGRGQSDLLVRGRGRGQNISVGRGRAQTIPVGGPQGSESPGNRPSGGPPGRPPMAQSDPRLSQQPYPTGLKPFQAPQPQPTQALGRRVSRFQPAGQIQQPGSDQSQTPLMRPMNKPVPGPGIPNFQPQPPYQRMNQMQPQTSLQQSQPQRPGIPPPMWPGIQPGPGSVHPQSVGSAINQSSAQVPPPVRPSAQILTRPPAQIPTRPPAQIPTRPLAQVPTRSSAHVATMHPAQIPTISPAHVATMSPAHVATMSPAHVATMSPAHVATMSPAHVATMSPAYQQSQPLPNRLSPQFQMPEPPRASMQPQSPSKPSWTQIPAALQPPKQKPVPIIQPTIMSEKAKASPSFQITPQVRPPAIHQAFQSMPTPAAMLRPSTASQVQPAGSMQPATSIQPLASQTQAVIPQSVSSAPQPSTLLSPQIRAGASVLTSAVQPQVPATLVPVQLAAQQNLMVSRSPAQVTAPAATKTVPAALTATPVVPAVVNVPAATSSVPAATSNVPAATSLQVPTPEPISTPPTDQVSGAEENATPDSAQQPSGHFSPKVYNYPEEPVFHGQIRTAHGTKLKIDLVQFGGKPTPKLPIPSKYRRKLQVAGRLSIDRVIPVVTDLPQHPEKGRFVVLLEVHPYTERDHRGYNKLCQELQNSGKSMVVDMKHDGLVLYLLPPDTPVLSPAILYQYYRAVRPPGVMMCIGVIRDGSMKKVSHKKAKKKSSKQKSKPAKKKRGDASPVFDASAKVTPRLSASSSGTMAQPPTSSKPASSLEEQFLSLSSQTARKAETADTAESSSSPLAMSKKDSDVFNEIYETLIHRKVNAAPTPSTPQSSAIPAALATTTPPSGGVIQPPVQLVSSTTNVIPKPAVSSVSQQSGSNISQLGSSTSHSDSSAIPNEVIAAKEPSVSSTSVTQPAAPIPTTSQHIPMPLQLSNASQLGSSTSQSTSSIRKPGLAAAQPMYASVPNPFPGPVASPVAFLPIQQTLMPGQMPLQLVPVNQFGVPTGGIAPKRSYIPPPPPGPPPAKRRKID
eukprot:182031_1